jgi:DNA-binding transcriptional ArsR family regulator
LEQGQTSGEAEVSPGVSAGRLAHALSHPQRLRLLGLLAKEPASPPMLRDQVDPELSLGVISYHVAVLRDYGCLELVRTVPQGGSSEHFYRANPEVLADPLYLELRAGAKS